MKCKIWIGLLIYFGFILSQCEKDDTITDAEGNVYSSVTIGTQVWMSTNLKTTKLNNGNSILVTDNGDWRALNTPGCSWYNNDAQNKDIYGGLYNWYAVTTGKLCPKGWHVPNDEEWHTLISTLDEFAHLGQGIESTTAGGKLKELGSIHWLEPNFGATNETGFNGLPGGYHSGNGGFDLIGENGLFWCSTEEYSGGEYAWERRLIYNYKSFYRYPSHKKHGLSVRCIKD